MKFRNNDIPLFIKWPQGETETAGASSYSETVIQAEGLGARGSRGPCWVGQRLFLVGKGWPEVGILSSCQPQVNGGPEGTGRGASIPFGFWWGVGGPEHQLMSVCRTAFWRRKGGLCFAFQTGQDGLRKRCFPCRLPLPTALRLQLRRKRLELCNLGDDDTPWLDSWQSNCCCSLWAKRKSPGSRQEESRRVFPWAPREGLLFERGKQPLANLSHPLLSLPGELALLGEGMDSSWTLALQTLVDH